MRERRFRLVGIFYIAVFILFTAFPIIADDVISKDEYGARRNTLSESIVDGVILLASPGIKDKSSFSSIENTPFYDFYYLSGFYGDDPEKLSYLAIVPSERITILFSDISFESRTKVLENTGIKHIFPSIQFDRFMKDVLADEKVYTLKSVPFYKSLSETKVDVNDKKLRGTLTTMRMIKSEGELNIMRKTADAVSNGITNAMKQVKPGITEADVKKIISDGISKNTGVTYHNLGMIVGSGPNSTIIHYDGDKRKIEDGDVIVCDISPAYNFYATDITRTIPANGKFTDEQKKIYQLVLDTQKAAEKELKPGVTLAELHKIADNYIKENGKDYYKYSFGNKIHYLGHYVGMAVHDVGGYTAKLKPGMVITIEPGIYDKEKNIGVRIEDTYVVTEDGFSRISNGVPREVTEIEKMMSPN